MLCFLFLNSLDSKHLGKVCTACGLEYPGMRTKSVPAEHLSSDLAHYFFQYPECRNSVCAELAHVAAPFVSRFQTLSEAKVVKELEAMEGKEFEDNFGKIVVALLLDGRKRLTKYALHLYDKLYEAEEKPLFDEMEALEMARLTAENKQLQEKVRKFTKQIETLEREVQRAKAELETQRVQCRQAVMAASESQKESNKKQGEIDVLRKELTNLQSQLQESKKLNPQVELATTVKELAKQSKKNEHYLEKLMENLRPTTASDTSPHLATLATVLTDLTGKMQTLSTRVDVTREEHHKEWDLLRRELQTLRVESTAAAKPMRRALPHREEEHRVGVFVDVQNMYYAARQFQARLNFEKLLQATVGKRRLIKAIAYVVRSREIDQSTFVTMLQQRNFEVKQKELRVRADGSTKGDWDMEMAIDIIRLAEQLDVVVLVSGDGDFVALVNLIKNKGPKVEVFSFPHNTSKDLMEAADRYCPIETEMLLR